MATPRASVMISPSRVFLDLAVMRRKFLDPLTPKCINHRYKQGNNPLISWDVLVTLNQRVSGSSPGAPTTFINNLNGLQQKPRRVGAAKKVINSYKLFWREFCRAAHQNIVSPVRPVPFGTFIARAVPRRR